MNFNRKLLLALLSIFILSTISAQSDTTYISVASWNLENLFDTIDDQDKNDEDFLPTGSKKWTNERLEIKKQNLAKVIKYMNNGHGPDILGVQEVEHEYLLEDLFKKHFPVINYKIAYAEAPDNRGIDNGLVYNADKFTFIEQNELEVILPDKYPTRLILHVKLKYQDEIINVFVNHWPSRRGGTEKSELNRIQAAQTLINAVEQIEKTSPKENIIILGDFNDEPENKSIYEILCANNGEKLFNLSFAAYKDGLGSYKYKDDWNMLDQIIVNNSLISGNFRTTEASFKVLKPKFAVQQEGRYKGTSLPTYGGRKYLGGFSDHYPVSIDIIYIK